MGDNAILQLSLTTLLSLVNSDASSSLFTTSNGISALEITDILKSFNVTLEPVTVDATAAIRDFLNSLGLNGNGLCVVCVWRHLCHVFSRLVSHHVGNAIAPNSFDITIDPAQLLAAALTTTFAVSVRVYRCVVARQ